MIRLTQSHRVSLRRWLQFGWLLLLPSLVQAADPTAEQIEFFEKGIRPLLVEKCYSCHSAQSPKAMGGLRLDTAESLLKGGDTGPAVVPGAPEKSLLIKAVTYKDLQLKMPPTGKLSDDEIQRLTAWVKMGAPDPRKEVAPSFNRRRASILRKPEPSGRFGKFRSPRCLVVRHTGWVRSPIDNFVLAQLESKGLKPAPPSRQTCLAAPRHF